MRRFLFRCGLVLSLAFAAAVGAALVQPSVAGAVEHPELDWDTLDMIPKRGWGVANQNPQNTQTETLDVLVYDMAQSGDYMFVGGAFLDVKESKNAQPIRQSYLAAFDVSTGEWVDTFRPTFDRAIYALDVLPNGSILVGGEFERVNGASRRGLVALDPISGQIDTSFAGAVDRPWSSRRATVRDIEIEPNGWIYVAGNFSHLDGAGGSRTQVAKVGRFANDSGVLDASWKPTVSGGAVWGLDTDPSRNEVAISGFFTSVNGERNSGHFHVIDDTNGRTVPGKVELRRNLPGAQPEIWDVVYGDDIIFAIGEQHTNQVLDADDHRMLGWHLTGARNPQNFVWSGFTAGGAYQAGDRIGDVMIIGCHCTYNTNNHYDSFSDRNTTRHNVMAYDAKTGHHIESFDADIDSPRDGHWAAASDTAGCLWIGGDYHVGGDENGSPRWVGGFARLCSPTPPIVVADPGAQVSQLGDQISLQVRATGGKDVTYRYTATGLPSGLTLDADTGRIEGTVDQLGFSTVTVTVDAAAGKGASGRRTFDWGVMDGVAPVLDPVGRTVVTNANPLDIRLRATDAENSAFGWRATGLPNGVSIDDSGVISGSAAAGTYSVVVTVTDLEGLSDSETFELVVVEVSAVDGITSYSGYSRSTGSFFMGWQFRSNRDLPITHLGAHDTDRNGRLSNQGATTAALIDPATQRIIAQVDIPADAPIEDGFAYAKLDRPVTVTANKTYIVASEISGEPYAYYGNIGYGEGITYLGHAYKQGSSPGWTNYRGGQGPYYFGATFRSISDPTPVVTAIGDRFDAVDKALTLQPAAELADGLNGTWTAAGLPTGLAVDATTGEVSGTPTAVGSYSVTIKVTDDLGLFGSTSFTWDILDGNPPVLQSISDQRVAEFDALSIQPQVAGNAGSLAWTAAGLPSGATIDAATGEITGVAAPDGTYTVAVMATDRLGQSGTTSFTLTVVDRPSTDAITSYSGFSRSTGSYFMGWEFTIDTDGQLSHLGAHDSNRNGRLDNRGATTAALIDPATQQILAQVDIPADAPVENGFAYAKLDQPVALSANTNYIVASEISGEPFAYYGSIDYGSGITYKGYAYKQGSNAGWTGLRGTNGPFYFGATFRLLGARPDLGNGGNGAGGGNDGNGGNGDGGNGDGGNDGGTALVAAGSTWRYDDSGADLGTAWRAADFDDAAWSSGGAEFGFGDGDEATVWASGNITYYARTTFDFTGTKPASLQLDLAADDGAVVYLNGVEILRDNLPAGPIDASTPAESWRFGADETFIGHTVSAAPLVDGRNVIAVEVHNVWSRNSDLSFDLRLTPSDKDGGAAVDELVAPGAEWAYTDSANGEPANWKAGIQGGQTGRAEFGFGDGDETTALNAGEDAYYFTRTFTVTDPGQVNQLTLNLAADDGAVVYLNGTEVHRFNMPNGDITPETRPITWVAGADETFQQTVLDGAAIAALQQGDNVIAVAVHNLWAGNSDLTFDLSLVAR